MHSHIGVYSYPDSFGTQDGNEMTNPVTPFMRVVDAYNAHDPAIDDILAGGVTTIQVLPGSGNAMGGQGALFKTWPRRSNHANIQRAQLNTSFITLKMACGENVKRVYGRGKGVMPMSRMGSAYVMRDMFFKAKKLLDSQNAWCQGDTESGDFPEDLALQPLVKSGGMNFVIFLIHFFPFRFTCCAMKLF
jgi:imidazolonepropionase-like amidohydrolase